MANVCVYLGILESFLQVIVDGFVGDFADEGEIRYSDLLLLRRLVGCFSNLRLRAASAAAGLWLCLSGIFLAAGSLGDSL